MAMILTVDAESSMRKMFSFTLKEAGFDVVEASDGVQGLEAAKSNSVSLIITDENMPNMDGISLVNELRSLPAHKFTPILLLTTESGMTRQ